MEHLLGAAAHWPWILASASPRRAALLAQIGVQAQVAPVDVAELAALSAAYPPEALVQANALAKAEAAVQIYPGRPVIAADTVVVWQGQLFGKPTDAADAQRMLECLSGARHHVYTGIALRGASGAVVQGAACTEVAFRALRAAEIAAYLASGEPFDKAGAYGIQGLGGLLVAEIHGDYGTVVGFSLPLFGELLGKLEKAEFESKS